MRKVVSAVTLMLLLTLTGTNAFTASETPHGKSLYARLGGKTAITAVVEEFVSRVADDDRINAYFASADLAKLKQHLVNQICQAAGGPCRYTGMNMKEAHAGMGITDAAFGALVEDLVATFDKFKVGEKEKGELLGVLGPMKTDIVETSAMGNK